MEVIKKHLISLFSYVFLVSALPAQAQETENLTPEQQAQSDALIQEAVEHYSAHRYGEAAECFKQAYEIFEEPELLFNIARSHEKKSNSEEAIKWYERFLEVPGTTSDLRTRALTSIAALRQEIAAKEEIQKSEEVPSEDTSAAPETEAEPGTEPASAYKAIPSIEPDPTFSDSPGSEEGVSTAKENGLALSPMKLWGYSLLGAGSIAIVVGTIYGGLAIGAKNDFESSGYEPDRVQYREEMRNKALVFDIVFSSGVALATAGITLLVVDAIKRKSNNEVARGKRRGQSGKSRDGAVTLTPTVVVENGGLTGGLTGHF